MQCLCPTYLLLVHHLSTPDAPLFTAGATLSTAGAPLTPVSVCNHISLYRRVLAWPADLVCPAYTSISHESSSALVPCVHLK